MRNSFRADNEALHRHVRANVQFDIECSGEMHTFGFREGRIWFDHHTLRQLEEELNFMKLGGAPSMCARILRMLRDRLVPWNGMNAISASRDAYLFARAQLVRGLSRRTLGAFWRAPVGVSAYSGGFPRTDTHVFSSPNGNYPVRVAAGLRRPVYHRGILRVPTWRGYRLVRLLMDRYTFNRTPVYCADPRALVRGNAEVYLMADIEGSLRLAIGRARLVGVNCRHIATWDISEEIRVVE